MWFCCLDAAAGLQRPRLKGQPGGKVLCRDAEPHLSLILQPPCARDGTATWVAPYLPSWCCAHIQQPTVAFLLGRWEGRWEGSWKLHTMCPPQAGTCVSLSPAASILPQHTMYARQDPMLGLQPHSPWVKGFRGRLPTGAHLPWKAPSPPCPSPSAPLAMFEWGAGYRCPSCCRAETCPSLPGSPEQYVTIATLLHAQISAGLRSRCHFCMAGRKGEGLASRSGAAGRAAGML